MARFSIFRSRKNSNADPEDRSSVVGTYDEIVPPPARKPSLMKRVLTRRRKEKAPSQRAIEEPIEEPPHGGPDEWQVLDHRGDSVHDDAGSDTLNEGLSRARHIVHSDGSDDQGAVPFVPTVHRQGVQLYDAPVRRSYDQASSMQDGALYVPPPRSRADSHARPPRQHVRTPASRTPQSHSAGARSRAATLPRQESAAASRAGTLHRQEQPLTRTGTLPRQSEFAATARTRTRPSRTASVDHTINNPMSHRPTTTGRARSVSHGGPARTSYTYAPQPASPVDSMSSARVTYISEDGRRVQVPAEFRDVHNGQIGARKSTYYIVPPGMDVIFRDKNGNELTRVGEFSRNRPRIKYHEAPIVVKDDMGRTVYRTHGARDSGSPYDASDVVHLGDLVPPQGTSAPVTVDLDYRGSHSRPSDARSQRSHRSHRYPGDEARVINI